MKRILLTIGFIFSFMVSVSFAEEPIKISRLNVGFVGGGVESAANLCPSGTYLAAWNGDYTGDSDKICFNSGTSNANGTQTGTIELDAAYGRSGIGLRITAINESLNWDTTGGIIAGNAAGTVWISVYLPASTGVNAVFEANANSTNNVECALSATGRASCSFQYLATDVPLNSGATQTIVDTTWGRIGYSWSVAGVNCPLAGSGTCYQLVCVCPNTSGCTINVTNCAESTTSLGAGGTTWTEFHLGEDVAANAVTDGIYLDDLKTFSVFGQADPGI